jgi:hypothetical protein
MRVMSSKSPILSIANTAPLARPSVKIEESSIAPRRFWPEL